MATTAISYSTGLLMGNADGITKRKLYLTVCLVGSLGLLFVFKYFNFFNDSLRAAFSHFNILYNVPSIRVLLPIGISFYTFQTLSYSIDVYRGNKEPERHLGVFALYVSFFPQLVAGPIERSTRLLPQFYRKNDFDYERVTSGLQLMLWGFFKKVVIADRLAILVNQVYNNPTEYTGITLIIATYFFAFQIYCDFSGYSDIAIGAAQVMGYDLMTNFNHPYFSRSVGEFWRRWHISLSTWFKDYLYIPLGGNRVSKLRWHFNIMAVFVISGLWHGANWTFLAWATLHGFYLLCSVWLRDLRISVATALQLDKHHRLRESVAAVLTFHLVTFAWIFFRANSISDAFYIVRNLFTDLGHFLLHITELGTGKGLIGGDLGLSKAELVLAFALILLMEVTHFLQRKGSIRLFFSERPIWIRWPAYYAAIFGTLFLGKYGVQEFIYFQF
ncbi:MAG: MBOAT family O-acyltransferase [Thermodesulfobacteriota bacterium]|nr:MBOAT family O-acyltransferase [Thermodesulfobacteriota bacterium]